MACTSFSHMSTMMHSSDIDEYECRLELNTKNNVFKSNIRIMFYHRIQVEPNESYRKETLLAHHQLLLKHTILQLNQKILKNLKKKHFSKSDLLQINQQILLQQWQYKTLQSMKNSKIHPLAPIPLFEKNFQNFNFLFFFFFWK